MTFVLEQSPTFNWPIVIRELIDGGRHRTHHFDAIYSRLPESRLEDMRLQYQRVKAAVMRDEEIDGLPTRAIAAEILAGWRGITEPDGQEVEFTPGTKAQLLEVPGVADVLVQTYFEAHDKARAKN